jgi:hypothetical protein
MEYIDFFQTSQLNMKQKKIRKTIENNTELWWYEYYEVILFDSIKCRSFLLVFRFPLVVTQVNNALMNRTSRDETQNW